MPWYLIAYLWTCTFLDTAGVTPRGLTLFVITLIIGIFVGAII